MTEIQTLPRAEPATEPEQTWICDRFGCERRAVVGMRFRDQAGHVHNCGPCERYNREWCDVVEVWPLPCRQSHVFSWPDQPRELT